MILKYVEKTRSFCRNSLYIASLSFISVHDGKNEFVLGKDANAKKMENRLQKQIENKTKYESLANHFHLYDGAIRSWDYQFIKQMSVEIAKKVLASLQQQFPEKLFIVYAEISKTNGVVIRFHQQWPDESPFYTNQYIESLKENGAFYVYSFCSLPVS